MGVTNGSTLVFTVETFSLAIEFSSLPSSRSSFRHALFLRTFVWWDPERLRDRLSVIYWVIIYLVIEAKFDETRSLNFAWPQSWSYSQNKQTPPLVLVLADFIIRSLPPPPLTTEKPCDIAIISIFFRFVHPYPCCLPSDSRMELLFLCFTAQFSGSSPCLNCDNREVKQRASGSGLFLYTWAVILSQRLGKSSL